jgi:hypothetical protein
LPRSDDFVAAGADRGGHARDTFLGPLRLASSATNIECINICDGLERVWIDFPIYYITTCVRNRKYVLAQDEAAQILVEECARLAAVRAGLLGDMSSCPIMFTSFAELN